MTDPTISDKRAAARARGEGTFNGTRCYYDGTYAKNTATGKCVECERYTSGIKAGRVAGEDNRTEAQKAGASMRRVAANWNTSEGWTDDMRRAHAEAIKRGFALKKARKRVAAATRTIPEARA